MINTDELKTIVQTLYKIVPSRTTMEILKTLKFQTTESGRIGITANDLEKSLTLYVNDSEKQYNFCVPAKTLNELMPVISSPEIDIKQNESSIVVNRNPGRTTIKTSPTDDFPETEYNTDGFDIDAQTLAYSLQKCLISASEDEKYSVLTGILIKSSNGILTVTSADGVRMTYIELLFGAPDFEIIMPAKAAKVLISVLKSGTVKMSIAPNKISFCTDDFEFSSQLIAGNFPHVEKIIPESWKTEISIDRALLTKAIKTAMIFSKDIANVVKFQIEDDVLKVFGESNETGSDVTPISDFSVSGVSIMEFAMNGKYLLDGLTLSGKNVILKLNDPNKPIGLYLDDDKTFVHIMMPMQVKK